MLEAVHAGRPSGAFGVVKMYHHEEVPGSCYTVANAEYWPVFDRSVPDVRPERRALQRLYLEEGIPLSGDGGPKQLVTAVFHAMIGACVRSYRGLRADFGNL